MSATLSLATLARIPTTVARPGYDVAALPVGIVHLGLGAFHRAHQAIYTDTVAARDPQWGICGVSLKTPRATQGLAAQDGLYTALEKSSSGARARIVGSVREALFLGSDRARVIARMADPRTRVVTLTVTEKGYCHDPATGRLNLAHPEIVRDLAAPDAATSAPGLLVAGLAARREAGAGALNVVCCDNLPHNGRVVEAIVTAFAQARDPGARGLDRPQRRVPVHDGRPHRPGDDRGRHGRGRATASASTTPCRSYSSRSGSG